MFKYLILINLIILIVNCQSIYDNDDEPTERINYDVRPNHRNYYHRSAYGENRLNRHDDYPVNDYENHRRIDSPYNDESAHVHGKIPTPMRHFVQRMSRGRYLGQEENAFIKDLMALNLNYPILFRKFIRETVKICMKYEKNEILDDSVENLPASTKQQMMTFFCTDN